MEEGRGGEVGSKVEHQWLIRLKETLRRTWLYCALISFMSSSR